MNIESGRNVIVTGGASGIGLQVARQLTSLNAKVALLDVDADRLETARVELGHRALTLACDVRSPSEVRSATRGATEMFGSLDALVVCAGVIHVRRLADVTEEDWDRSLDVNLKGAFLTCQAAAPALVDSKRGRIVMISSDAGRRGVPLLHAYSASKSGMIGLAEALAAELAPDVTVNCVCPVGVPSTGMGQQLLSWKSNATKRSADQIISEVALDIPLGRNATERDVANAVSFFLSDAASFITGVALDLDGGASLNAIPGAQKGATE